MIKRQVNLPRESPEKIRGPLSEDGRYRAIFMDSPESILLVDPEGVILDCNRDVTLTGLRREEIIGSFISELNFSFSSGRAAQEILAGILSGEMAPLEEEITSPTGKKIWGRITPSLVSVGGNRAIRLLVQDMTQRKVEEERLQDSEELFRSIFQDSPVGIELYDARGLLQRVNPACLDIFGVLDASEISQFNLFENPNLSHGHKELLRRGERIRYEAPFDFDRVKEAGQYRTRRSGTIFLDVVITPTAKGGYLVQIQEITERRRAEEALRVAKLRQEAAVTGGGVGLWDWNMVTGQVWFSPEWKRQVGCEDHEIGEGFAEWENRVHPQDLEPVLEEIRGSLEGMKPGFEAEFRFRHKDGSWRWILARASFLRDTRGRPLRTLGSHLDITERKEREMARKELEEKLTQSQKMESVGRLAGGVAHDFNNMLNVILGHAELLQDDLDPSDPAAESLREIQKAAEHSADLTRQLLAFARRQTALPRVLDLNESLTAMLSMLSRVIGEDVSLSWNPGVSLWAVRVDPTQIHQILMNLCVNARDAVPEGGSITIGTQNVTIGEEESLRNPALRPGEFVLLTVKDDGVGIPQDALAHIFEPFFTTKELNEGTGLGLATVYGIAKQNDGFVDVESAPELGTTLRVYLPRFQDPEKARTEGRDQPPSPDPRRPGVFVEISG